MYQCVCTGACMGVYVCVRARVPAYLSVSPCQTVSLPVRQISSNVFLCATESCHASLVPGRRRFHRAQHKPTPHLQTHAVPVLTHSDRAREPRLRPRRRADGQRQRWWRRGYGRPAPTTTTVHHHRFQHACDERSERSLRSRWLQVCWRQEQKQQEQKQHPIEERGPRAWWRPGNVLVGQDQEVQQRGSGGEREQRGEPLSGRYRWRWRWWRRWWWWWWWWWWW